MILSHKKLFLTLLLCSTFHPGTTRLVDADGASPSGVTQPTLSPAGTIPVQGVEGRWDHFAFDAVTGRLFVSALENHSLEVFDLKKRRLIRSITGINEPQGVLFVPGMDRLLVCSRGDGTIRSFDARTFTEGPWVDVGHNADNLRLDTKTKTVYVGSNGEPGPGAVSAINLASLVPVTEGGVADPPRSPADILLDHPRRADARAEVALESHPESFQIDAASGRLFVNEPDAHRIVLIDTPPEGLKISGSIPVTISDRNFPMAYDAASSRLFIACRQPAMVAAYNVKSGELIARAPCVGDADDLYFDAASHRLYVIGGGPPNGQPGTGGISVFDTSATEKFTLLANVLTAPRARTGIFIPSLKMLAVAAPHTPGHAAGILLFDIH